MTARRLAARVALPAAALVGAAGLLAPLVDAGPYRERIRLALERSLHRHVKVGGAHYSLLRGPGFEVKDVLIEDTPGAGVEPFAYVGSLEATVRLTSLWTGRLSFSTLRLNDATVNLVKTAEGPWNVQEFLGGAPASADVPAIEIRSARLNFKYGDTKSIFYLNDVDMDIYPASNGAIGVRLSGSPARTDRPAQGFGEISARGLFQPGEGGRNRLSMGVQLERSNVSDLLTLVAGHELGIHGLIDASLHLDGSLAGLAITGRLNLADMHRWDLMPAEGEGWPLRLRGEFNLPGQTLDLETEPAEGQTPPVRLRLSLTGFLREPRWSLTAELRDAPAGPMAAAARHFGAPIPEGTAIAGVWNGTVNYASGEGWTANAVLTEASVAGAAIARGELAIAGGEAVFGPAEVTLADGRTALAGLRYSLAARSLVVTVKTDRMGIAELREASRTLGAAPMPPLDVCHGGTWSGETEYAAVDGGAGTWKGKYELEGTEIAAPEFSAPVRIAAAAVTIEEGRVQVTRMRGRVGKNRFEGEMRFDADAAGVVRVKLASAELDLLDLERAVRPLEGGGEGLLARLRLRRPATPAWMKDLKVEGTIEAGELTAGGETLGSARARLAWDGPRLELNAIEWRREEAEGTGKLTVSLSGAPRFHLIGHVTGMKWREGTLGFDGTLTAAGAGEALVDSAAAKGTFTAEAVTLAPDAEFDEMTGTYALTFAGGAARLGVDNVEATQGDDAYTGRGETQEDGRILLELNSARRQIRQLTAGLHLGAGAEPR